MRHCVIERYNKVHLLVIVSSSWSLRDTNISLVASALCRWNTLLTALEVLGWTATSDRTTDCTHIVCIVCRDSSRQTYLGTVPTKSECQRRRVVSAKGGRIEAPSGVGYGRDIISPDK